MLMKAKSLLILAALIFSIFSPLTFHMQESPDSHVTCVMTLDVCHAKGSPFTVNVDIPLFCGSPVELFLPEEIAFYVISDRPFIPRLVSRQLEHPPEV